MDLRNDNFRATSDSVQPLLWVLEDDADCQFVYQESLSLKFQVRMFSSVEAFSAGLVESGTQKPSLIVADLRLTDGSFLSFLKSSRLALLTGIPFFVVSSIDDLDILRYCFELGAKDYLTKPFKKTELVVKIERALHLEPSVANFENDIRISPIELVVEYQGRRSLTLTSKEFQILNCLKQNIDSDVSKEILISTIWGKIRVSGSALDVHLFNLRKKIEATGLAVVFNPSGGYRLVKQ